MQEGASVRTRSPFYPNIKTKKTMNTIILVTLIFFSFCFGFFLSAFIAGTKDKDTQEKL